MSHPHPLTSSSLLPESLFIVALFLEHPNLGAGSTPYPSGLCSHVTSFVGVLVTRVFCPLILYISESSESSLSAVHISVVITLCSCTVLSLSFALVQNVSSSSRAGSGPHPVPGRIHRARAVSGTERALSRGGSRSVSDLEPLA